LRLSERRVASLQQKLSEAAALLPPAAGAAGAEAAAAAELRTEGSLSIAAVTEGNMSIVADLRAEAEAAQRLLTAAAVEHCLLVEIERRGGLEAMSAKLGSAEGEAGVLQPR